MGPVAVSLSNRWQSVEAHAEDPARQNLLLQSFSEARELPFLPARLGIAKHPMIRRCLSLLTLKKRKYALVCASVCMIRLRFCGQEEITWTHYREKRGLELERDVPTD